MRTLLAGCLVLFAASTAAAQPEPNTLFVDGNVFANSGWRSHTDSSSLVASPDPNGTVFGGGASVGTWLTPRFSVRLEFAALANLNRNTDGTEPVSTATGLNTPVADRLSISTRERTASVLLGYHTARHHGVEFGYLGGVAFIFLTEREEETFTPASLLLAPTVIPVESFNSHSYGAQAEVGLDADIALGRRVSVVPQVRLISDGVSLRSGVALRARW